MLNEAEIRELRRRKRLFGLLRIAKATVRFPTAGARMGKNFLRLIAEIDRLHGSPRKKISAGRDCVLDLQTWLVNGHNIELGDFVKVSAFSALIAGSEAKIHIGNYSILGPGVFVVAANHGMESNGVPVRYQPWKEKSVVIGDDVWIGANAVILPGSSIGAGAVIGAGTVVNGEVPPGAIAFQEKGSLTIRQRR